jgi:hypothetical protein
MAAIMIRDFIDTDADAVWTIMEPILRAGETYALPTTLSKDEALDYWLSNEAVFVAEDAGILLGTYFLRANHEGGGSHVANSSNERACKLWQSFDFIIVGRLPGAFQHPQLGFVDVFVMYREL